MADYITVDDMRALEANSNYFGVSYGELMENAGKGVAASIISKKRRCSVLVLCGTGNNGGDGFVTARYLRRANFEVFTILLGHSSAIKPGPTSVNLERLRAVGVDVREIVSPEMLPKEIFESYDIIVDAILGTGVKGAPREPASSAIDLINQSSAYKVSIDMPSGLDPDTGECLKCVKPDLVITFHAPKKGLEKYNIEVADIGIPEKAMKYVGPGNIRGIKTRGDYSHKGESGRVLIIGGGPYTGAPALSGLTALKAGADVVTIAAPSRAADIIASFSPDLIVKPLTDRDILVDEDIERLTPLLARNDVVVMGMGLGDDLRTLAAVSKIMSVCERIVIDADALRPDMPLRGIVTPHRGEFKRISGEDVSTEEVFASETVRSFSESKNIVTVLKGKIDIISDGKLVKFNGTGNAGMTVGGTGDVLAGIIGALYCKNSAFDAACAGTFINGAAGDMAFDEKGYGLVASDVVNMIPYAMKKYRHYL